MGPTAGLDGRGISRLHRDSISECDVTVPPFPPPPFFLAAFSAKGELSCEVGRWSSQTYVSGEGADGLRSSFVVCQCHHSSFIDIDIFINCNWFVTQWQDAFTHEYYIEQHK
jgi:hypothetical protein